MEFTNGTRAKITCIVGNEAGRQNGRHPHYKTYAHYDFTVESVSEIAKYGGENHEEDNEHGLEEPSLHVVNFKETLHFGENS